MERYMEREEEMEGISRTNVKMLPTRLLIIVLKMRCCFQQKLSGPVAKLPTSTCTVITTPVAFPSAKPVRTQLYCLVTEAHACERLVLALRVIAVGES